MSPLSARQVAGALLLILVALLLPSRVAIWLDEHGRATLSNRSAPPSPEAVVLSPEDLRTHWQGQVVGEPLPADSDSSGEEDRFTRELLTSRDDIRRGELRLGLRRLRRLHREFPQRPEPAWMLAQVERRRGRLEPALEALEAALSLAAHMPADWRDAAEQLRGEIDAELKHAKQAYVPGAPIRVQETEHFRISYDHQFAGRKFGQAVVELLEDVSERLSENVGRKLARALEVRLYTRAQYLESYQHRFGFATVGFYDGAIHVVSQRHPADNLFALLVHEYAHAIFEEALGSHQPFFLNEGIADREEERARGRGRLSRGEWRQLLDALRDERWIPLGSIVRGFGGLEGKRALMAYVEARAAVELISDRFPGAIARWLERCDRGQQWEDALEAETSWRLRGLERALMEDVRSRFPKDPLARRPLPLSPPAPSSRSRPDSPSGIRAGDLPDPSRSGARARG